MSSPVFDAVFSGKMTGGDVTIEPPITVPDLTTASFKDLLQWVIREEAGAVLTRLTTFSNCIFLNKVRLKQIKILSSLYKVDAVISEANILI